MWPFDLRGPEFLLFYAIAGAVVLTAAYLLRHSGEPADAPKINLSDPCLIAYLRGGKNETLRVLTVSLVDPGLLVASANKIAAVAGRSEKPAWSWNRRSSGTSIPRPVRLRCSR